MRLQLPLLRDVRSEPARPGHESVVGSESHRNRSLPRTYEVTPLGVDAVVHDVNNRGEFAGQWVNAEGELRAVRLGGSAFTDIGTLGGTASAARGINDDGAVVGGALVKGNEVHHAFLYEDGVMYDLNDLLAPGADFELVHALAINDRGEIVAVGHRDGTDHVVLLKPRPAAATQRE